MPAHTMLFIDSHTAMHSSGATFEKPTKASTTTVNEIIRKATRGRDGMEFFCYNNYLGWGFSYAPYDFLCGFSSVHYNGFCLGMLVEQPYETEFRT